MGRISAHRKGYFRLLALVLGIPLSIGAFLFLKNNEKKAASLQFSIQVANQAQAVQREINANLAALYSLRAFLEVAPPNEEKFQRYAREVGMAYPSIQALEWIPRVSQNDRATTEREMSARSGYEIVFHEGHPSSVRTSPQRDTYFPVQFYWGRNPPPGIDLIGLDLAGSSELVQAMNLSRETGTPAASRQWPLRERNPGGHGIMAFLPVFRNGVRPPARDNTDQLLGYAFILFRAEDLLKQGLIPFDRQGMDVYVFDQSAQPRHRNLFFSGANAQSVPLTQTALASPTSFRSTHQLMFANREWTIVCDGTHQFLTSTTTWQPYFFLFCGLLGTALLTIYFHTLYQYSVSSEQMVSQLTSLNTSLQETITEQKKIEQELAIARDKALDAMKSKADFFATMSHEIRTPMNGILGLTDLVLKSELPADQQSHMETVKTCGTDLLRILDGILDLSKSETGQIQLESIPIHLHAKVIHVTDLYISQADSKNIHFQVDWDQQIPHTLLGDPLRLRQILTNLISNALKFTENGTISIQGSLVSQQDNIANIRIRVQDTGIGISEEGLKRLFRPYTQADNSTSRKYGGTGLGLSIVKHLVELMKGSIEVESILHQGTSFILTIPFEIPASEVIVKDSLSTSEVSRKFSGLVLMAEDNRVNQIIQKRQLESLGFNVDTVSNGKDVIEAIRSTRYCCIFLDCQMPILDGYETAQYIRNLEKYRTEKTPLIAITAHTFPNEKSKCLKAGMDAVLTKPVKVEELIRVLDQFDFPETFSSAQSA